MRYSLINVSSERDGFVDGYWLQDVNGSFDEAERRASETEKINGGRITIVVVEGVNNTNPLLYYYRNLKRLHSSC